MIASLLAAATAALLLFVFTSNAHSFASRALDARLQARAFVESETAVKTCEGEGGLAKCGKDVVFVNELERLPEPENRAEAEKRICVSRIVLVGGEQKTARFCAENRAG